MTEEKGITFKHIPVREDIFNKFLRFGVYRETYSDTLDKIMHMAKQHDSLQSKEVE